MHPAVGCHYFPPGLRLPLQPQTITTLWPVPSYTAWWQRHIIIIVIIKRKDLGGVMSKWLQGHLTILKQWQNASVTQNEKQSEAVILNTRPCSGFSLPGQLLSSAGYVCPKNMTLTRDFSRRSCSEWWRYLVRCVCSTMQTPVCDRTNCGGSQRLCSDISQCHNGWG